MLAPDHTMSAYHSLDGRFLDSSVKPPKSEGQLIADQAPALNNSGATWSAGVLQLYIWQNTIPFYVPDLGSLINTYNIALCKFHR